MSGESCDDSEPWLAPLAWPEQPRALLVNAACPAALLLAAVMAARLVAEHGGRRTSRLQLGLIPPGYQVRIPAHQGQIAPCLSWCRLTSLAHGLVALCGGVTAGFGLVLAGVRLIAE